MEERVYRVGIPRKGVLGWVGKYLLGGRCGLITPKEEGEGVEGERKRKLRMRKEMTNVDLGLKKEP
jgi:hypothetical protein